MRTKLASACLTKLFTAKLNVLLVGAPGVGKTDIVKQAAAAAGFNLVISHPVVSDPADFKGLPFRLEGRDEATFLPYDDLAQIMRATDPTVWFFDDSGQAPPAVQAAMMQIFLARELNGKRIPDCVTFCAATNRRQDRAGVQGLLEPLKSRFATIIQVDPDADDFIEWATANDVYPLLPAFIAFRRELLHVFTPTPDMTNSPSPRTWVNVANLEGADLPREALRENVSGAVGAAAANEYLAFRTVYEQLPDPMQALIDPSGAPVPTEVSACFAIAAALASKTTAQTFPAFLQYLGRLPSRDYMLFAVQVAVKKQPAICKTPAWTKFAASDVGRKFIDVNA